MGWGVGGRGGEMGGGGGWEWGGGWGLLFRCFIYAELSQEEHRGSGEDQCAC